LANLEWIYVTVTARVLRAVALAGQARAAEASDRDAALAELDGRGGLDGLVGWLAGRAADAPVAGEVVEEGGARDVGGGRNLLDGHVSVATFLEQLQCSGPDGSPYRLTQSVVCGACSDVGRSGARCVADPWRDDDAHKIISLFERTVAGPRAAFRTPVCPASRRPAAA
jgi:hypothetical protein